MSFGTVVFEVCIEQPQLMDRFEEILAIDWPESFVVVYRDGSTERLLRGAGVTVSPPDDEADGIGGFYAEIPKKHPLNQKQCGRYVPFTEIDRILDEAAKVLLQVP